MLALEKFAPGRGHVGLVEKDVPRLGAGEVLVEVYGAGVCGTDLHIRDGGYPSDPPVTMGHEVTGVIREVGPGVRQEWAAQRVTCETFYSTCGECPWCREARPNLCPRRRSIGSGANGGFAPLMVVSSSQLHLVPSDIDEHAAALCEPLACVCQSLFDPCVVAAGDDVLITGPGTMGLLAAQVARACGGRPFVLGTEADKARLAKASDLGFDVGLITERRAMTALGSRSGPQVVVECSGAGMAMATGLEVIRRGGRYVQIGQTTDRVSVPLALASFKELWVTGGFASTPRSWARAMVLLEGHLIDLACLVSEVVALAEWERVFEDIEAARGLKYVLDPRK